MISSKMFFRSFRDGCFHDAFVLVEFIEETVRAKVLKRGCHAAFVASTGHRIVGE